MHNSRTCPDEDCHDCIRGCLGCGAKYGEIIDGYCSKCAERLFS